MRNLPMRLWRRMEKRIRLLSYATAADCFLISYPKSGRTWFRFILSHYFNSIAGLNVDTNLHNMFSVLPNFDLDKLRGVPAFAFDKHQPRIPFIPVSHLGYKRSLFLDRPVIFMIRDPRDVMVSAYFHATRHKHRFDGSMSEFIMNKEQGLPALVRYINEWSQGLTRRKFVVISYEALSQDPEVETAKALSFLECEFNSPALKNAVEAGRFSAMQEREKSEGLPAHDYDRTDSESLRMRRGQAGGYDLYLTAEQISIIEKICAQTLTAKGKLMVAKTGMRILQ